LPSTPGSENDGAFHPKLQIGACSATLLYLVKNLSWLHMANRDEFRNRAAACEVITKIGGSKVA
jgi:hypothetical protein